MSNIGNPAPSSPNKGGLAGIYTTERVRELIKKLHDAMPLLEKEYDDLERRNNEKHNNIFSIKMDALSSVYNASKVLYEWYIERYNRQF